MVRNVAYNPDDLVSICKRFKIARLSLYGSVLRDDFDPTRSDVDVLIAFEPDADKSLFVLVDIQDTLTALFGRQAHLCTVGSLSRYIRKDVMQQAEVQYDAA